MQDLTAQNAQLNDTLRQLTHSADQLAELQKRNEINEQSLQNTIGNLKDENYKLHGQIDVLESKLGKITYELNILKDIETKYQELESKYKIMKKKLKREKDDKEV